MAQFDLYTEMGIVQETIYPEPAREFYISPTGDNTNVTGENRTVSSDSRRTNVIPEDDDYTSSRRTDPSGSRRTDESTNTEYSSNNTDNLITADLTGFLKGKSLIPIIILVIVAGLLLFKK